MPTEHKDSKSAVLYFKPASIGRAGGARCGACWKFLPAEGKCLEVEGDISAGAVCGLYVHGMPHHDGAPAWKITKVSKPEAGYEERGDTHCVNCEYMVRPGDHSSPCREVEGIVEQQGCCNEHEHR
jgi:hypothetical protein